VTENLAQSLVDHRNVHLTSQTVSEFPFHHAKRGFDVAGVISLSGYDGSTPGVVINAAMAKQYWPQGRSSIGAHTAI
jgi:hypothetical protein